MTETNFPQHPFWDYSLRLYGAPGVSEACLKLQDEYGLDVNLILFCLWAGTEGPGRITADELATALARTAPWQRQVVERIRWLRRTLKLDELGATRELVDQFRPAVQELEISAEHVEQLVLASLVPASRGAAGAPAAVENLLAYFAATGVSPGCPACTSVITILAQALSNGDLAAAEAMWPG